MKSKMDLATQLMLSQLIINETLKNTIFNYSLQLKLVKFFYSFCFSVLTALVVIQGLD